MTNYAYMTSVKLKAYSLARYCYCFLGKVAAPLLGLDLLQRRNRGGNCQLSFRLRSNLIFCGSSRLASRKIFEPSHKSWSEWLPGLIAGLQDSSPEESKMHQNSCRPGLCPGPHWESLQRSYPRTSPPSRPFGLRASTLRALPRPRNVDFVLTPLICWLISVGPATAICLLDLRRNL